MELSNALALAAIFSLALGCIVYCIGNTPNKKD